MYSLADIERREMSRDLFSVIVYGNINDVKALIEAGADVNVLDNIISKMTPLHEAAWYSKRDIVELLLNMGADQDAKDKEGNTALHMAAYHGNVAIAQLLLDRGADVNVSNQYDRTPLHMAATHGKKDVVALLLDRGADKAAKDDEGKTALEMSKKEKKDGSHHLIMALLSQ